MDLSVIIVSFNVKFFLEQCLYAVYKSAAGIDAEVIVVDNHSVDGTCQMIRDKFPGVKLIGNNENRGFAKANNQGIRASTGRYILLLNPDTVVEEDSFSTCITFVKDHPETGCLGVKMIDGKGKFLPESRRALPTPQVAFYKIFGFSALFPKHRKFGRYYLGYLDASEIHPVDVVSGAFMFLQKSSLEKTGLLDEDFFMYGEDVDLSYRLKINGYENYYVPLTTIIHYKGESTKKGSVNYVILFYRAMILFARKHLSGRNAGIFSALIHLAIYFRAAMALIKRFIRGAINPVLDAIVIYTGYAFFIPLWAVYKFGADNHYPDAFLYLVIPCYVFIWVVSVYFSGGYEKLVKIGDQAKGIFSGTLLILIVYALLPEQMRFSRALILVGACWAMLVVFANRMLLSLIDSRHFKFELKRRKKRIVIIGSSREGKRAAQIIQTADIPFDLIGFVAERADVMIEPGFLGHIDQIRDIVEVNDIEEIIFCAHDLSSRKIIKTMLLFSDADLDFKIAPPESLSIIGSNSIHTAGELYGIYTNSLARRLNRHKKRLFDILTAIILLLAIPLWGLLLRNMPHLLRNSFLVLAGKRSWVGYIPSAGNPSELPALKPGILSPLDGDRVSGSSREVSENLNLLYAKNYRVLHDVEILMRGFRKIGERK